MYQVAAFLHLLAAIVWLGGTLFLAMVLVPLSRQMQSPPGMGGQVLSVAARRFRSVGWGALSLLVVTGLWLLIERGLSLADILRDDGAFYQTLRLKMALVALLLVLSSVHDFILGPRVASALSSPAVQTATRRRKLLLWLARLNVVIALAIVATGIVLLRGVPGN